MRAGRTAPAVAAAEAALAARNSTPEGAFALADIYQEAKRHDAAIALLNGLVAKAPGDDELAFRLAAAYESAGRVAEAERVFRALVARDPLHANALNYLGYMLANRGLRLTEALSLIDRALAADPGNPAFLDSRGWALLKLGRAADAEAPLRTAAEALRSSSVIQSHYADVLSALGKRGEAADRLELALAGDGVDVDRAATRAPAAATRPQDAMRAARMAVVAVAACASAFGASCAARVPDRPAGVATDAPGGGADRWLMARATAGRCARPPPKFACRDAWAPNACEPVCSPASPNPTRCASRPWRRLARRRSCWPPTAPRPRSYFPRDAQVLRDAPVAAVLDALTGLALDAADLRRLIFGCVVGEGGRGRKYGTSWQVVEAGDTRAFLKNGVLVAADYLGWQVDYAAHDGGIARSVRVRRVLPRGAIDLVAVLSSVETNSISTAAAFTVAVPAERSADHARRPARGQPVCDPRAVGAGCCACRCPRLWSCRPTRRSTST